MDVCGTTYGMGCACGMHAFVSVLGRRAGTEGADNRTGSDVRTCGCAVGCRAFQLRNIEAVTCEMRQGPSTFVTGNE